MPSFANPYSGDVPRPMTNPELAQAIRLDLASELEAIFLYEAHALACEDPVAKKVLMDIRDEEKEHMGELLTLLQYLDPAEAEHYGEGADEVAAMLKELGIEPTAAQETKAAVIDKAQPAREAKTGKPSKTTKTTKDSKAKKPKK